MRKCLIFCVFFCCQAYSQVIDPTDIFEGISPLWTHLAFDSSTIGGTYNGMNHLSGFAGYGPKVYGDYCYIVYNDASNGDQGALIEKINIKTGNKIWMNNINLRNYSKREKVSNYFINDKNELVLLNFRSIENQVFAVWVDAKLAVRTYDADNGNLLKYEYTEPGDSSSPNLASTIDAKLYPFNNNEYEYISHLRDSFNYIFYRSLLNSNRMLYLNDELRIKNKFLYTAPEVSYAYNARRDTLIVLRFSYKTYPFMLGDSMELNIDLYDNNFTNFNSYNIADKISKASEYFIRKAEDGHIFITGNGFENSSIEPVTERISIFDINGNLEEELTLPKERILGFSSSNCIKLKNQPGALILRSLYSDASRTNCKIQFFVSDGKSNVSLTKEIPLKEQQGLLNHQLFQTNEGDVILFGDYKGKPDWAFTYLTGRSIIAKFAAKDLGILTGSKELKPESAVDIYPNPADDNVFIDSKNIVFNKLQIQDLYGRIVSNQNCYNTKGILAIRNISDFVNGVYVVLALGRQNEILFRKEIVVNHK